MSSAIQKYDIKKISHSDKLSKKALKIIEKNLVILNLFQKSFKPSIVNNCITKR